MPYGYDGLYAIHGCPGGGKTTRVARTVERICAAAPPEDSADGRSPAIVVSLTNAAAREAAGRDMPLRRDAVGTLHSRGYRSLGCPPLVTSALVAEEWNRRHPSFALSAEAFSRAPDDEDDDPTFRGGGQMPGDDAYAEYEIARHRLETDGMSKPARALADAWTAFKRDFGVIDFTDMIEHGGPSGMRPGVVIADEFQDFSRLEYAYLRRLADAEGAALILTGDADQCIYQWRGADYRLLNDPCAKHDTIRASHRLPRAVHAQAWATLARAKGHGLHPYDPRGADGAVVRSGADLRDMQAAIGIAADAFAAGKSVMILATANYMADQVAAELRSVALPFGNPWRTRRGAWNPLASRAGMTKRERLLAFTRWHDSGGEAWTLGEVAAWLDPVSSKKAGLPRGAKERVKELCADKENARACPSGDDLRELIGDTAVFALASCADGKAAARWWYSVLVDSQSAGARYPLDVYLAHGRKALERPPEKGAPMITPGTVHSVKGGEADVVILFPDIPWAAEVAREESAEAEDALTRLFYVGMTRAKETLVLCEPAGRRGEGAFAW